VCLSVQWFCCSLLNWTPTVTSQMADAFVATDDENLHTGDAWGTPINPYARLAFAKGLHPRLGAGADSVLTHLREELLCEQIVSTTVRAERQYTDERTPAAGGWCGGATYEGEWKGGKMHGQGKWTDPFSLGNTGTYEGEWEDDVQHGQGKYTFANGRTYEGEFKDGKMHGQGKETDADGDTYEGEWKDNKKRGQGKHTYADGRTYEGEYKDGYQHGQGKGTHPDGSTYEGEWKDGKSHGQGKMTYADGRTDEGRWEESRFIQ